MITAGNVLDRVRKKLNDLGDVRWTVTEHLEAVNDGQTALLEAKPDLFEVYVFHDLVPGPVQDVPDDCYFLFDVVANAQGSTITKPISKVERSTLDRQRGNWLALKPDAQVVHWCQSPREKAKFWVVPPQPSTGPGRVYLRHARYPAVIDQEVDPLDAPDECLNALYHFCMHRALEKDEKFSGSQQAQFHWQKFAQYAGVRAQAEAEAEGVRAATEKTG